MACGCAGCATGSRCNSAGPLELQSRAAWSRDLSCGMRAAEMAIQTAANAGPLTVQSYTELEDKPFAAWAVHDVGPAEGMGWLELSSPQAFVAWGVETSVNGVNRIVYRRTGPATRSGVWVEQGAVVRCYPVGTMTRTGGANEDIVDPISGVERSIVVAAYPGDIVPRASVRFFGGARPSNFWHQAQRQLAYDGFEVSATPGVGASAYPVGYETSAACVSGAAWTWSEETTIGTAATLRTVATQTATSFQVPCGPWSRITPTIAGGAASYGAIFWSSHNNGLRF